MTNLFENPWLLLTIAALSIVPAAIVRQAKPEWGYRPLLIPVVLAALGIGLDLAVQTDKEQIHALVRQCRAAVIEENIHRLRQALCDDYDDGFHRSKADLLLSSEQALKGAAIRKVRFQNLDLTRHERQAQVDLNTVVHLRPESRYAAFGSVVFVSVRLEFAKLSSERWCIRRIGILSVNNQPVNWGAVRYD